MDTKFPGFIAAGCHHAPLPPSHQEGLSLQGRVVEALYGYEECIEVEMGYDALRSGHEIQRYEEGVRC